ncbi:nucleotide-binding oligomerization domain-containing protein 2-like [Acropora millepora]|uniref:nucleotide-binding oligomerization domain-containing protein 2-like n=1 Tax=Acropora millepora TaxID=45264 RepID=UPI001CF10A9D|nr:nucleotide-binding oligomerization domain-containing protein 2-like [Acropora millepora]
MTIMNETFQCCDCLSISVHKNTPVCRTQIRSDDETIKCKMVDCTAIKDAIIPKTLNQFTFALVIVWIVVGATLCIAFSELEISESRYDIRCGVTGNTLNIDFIRAKCYDQYRIESHKLGIPPYLFIIVNVLLIPTVTLIYSQYAKSTVTEVERSPQDAHRTPRNRRRTLFIAYICHLIISMVLEITFITMLETQLFYPSNFPSDFSCTIENLWLNRTQNTNLFTCFNQRAGNKNVWIKVVKAANGIFALLAFLEIIWISSRARHGKKFMENWKFYADHLKSNSDQQRVAAAEETPCVQPQHQLVNIRDREEPPDNTAISQPSEHPEHPQAQTDFQRAIQELKENYLTRTEKPSDLKQPFGRPKLGEGEVLDLALDEIYVNVAIHEGRSHHFFADPDRWEQLKEYPPDPKDCEFVRPEDMLDENHKNVLVVGRPGIGKTSLSTKVLRLWASGEAFNAAFNVVFLVKFRRFNGGAKLSLRELLASAETVQRLDDSVWEFVQNHSTKVLLIFDGLDEYSRKEGINTHEEYENDMEEKMPVSVLYKKLAAGELLRGASILTTTRPTAVKYVAHSDVERTVEIRGFTSENVEQYVKKFTKRCPGANEKILGHIKSNINLFSLCYIPVNCFLICHCLLQSILCKSSQLPTRMTDIYQMTVKMILFNHMHDREGFSRKELEKLRSTHMYEPFENFPEELQKLFNKVGEIAHKGIAEGRLLFESSEVSGLEDCGLLHKLPDLEPKAWNYPRKSQFCFLHLTVQEFFTAKHLVNTKTKEEIERFVCDHIKHGTWQVVLQFVAGLLNSSSDIFIKLLPKPSEGEWPATREDKDLAVQVCKCLYEINDEQQPVLQNKIEKMKFNTVKFSLCSLAPIDVAAVLYFLSNAEEVLNFDLSYNQLGDLGANEVKKFIVNRERKLKRLALTGNNLTDNAAKDFAAALEHSNCKLETLELSNNNFTDNAAKDFASALEHSNCKLKTLYLIKNNFTDNAAKDFAAALKHSNCKLETLYLSDNNFTDNAAKDFAAALRHSNCKLESLDLRDNRLTDNAAKDFAAALKHSNCKLGKLFLYNNNFTDNVAKDFAAALKHSNCKLETLFLSEKNFTKEGRRYLTDAETQSNCKVALL